MSWPDFVVQMSQAWAWPAVAGSAIIMLRRQIRSAADRFVERVGEIARLQFPGGSVDFRREVEQLAHTTEELKSEQPQALPTTRPEEVVLPPETAEQRLAKYEQLAVVDPRAAILLPFSDLEGLIRQRFRELYPQERANLGFNRIVEMLHRDGRLDDDIAGSLRQMSRIRNQVAHERTELDLDIPGYFVESVGNVLGYLILTDFFKGDQEVQEHAPTQSS